MSILNTGGLGGYIGGRLVTFWAEQTAEEVHLTTPADYGEWQSDGIE